MIYGSSVVYNFFNIYAVRMAGEFMIPRATIWLSTGVMHHGWAFLTYVLALVLTVKTRLFLLADLDLTGMGAGD